MTSAVESMPALSPAGFRRRHLASTMVLATVVLLYLFAGLSLTWTGVADGRAAAVPVLPGEMAGGSSGAAGEAPPEPEPLAFREMTPEEAASYNAAIPVASQPNPAASPFGFAAASDNDRLRAVDCLTAAIYYEAAIEPLDGQRAVAQVVLNRVRHPAFPKTVCGVVFQGSERATGCQFTFTCDGSLRRLPSQAGWSRARKVAEEALAGKVYKPVGYSTHYHTYWVVPYWSSSLTKLANVGSHIFYRWEGSWGRPPAFRHRASGTEPAITLIRHLSSAPLELAEGELPTGEQAAEGTIPSITADMRGRGVVRRYEPIRAESVAAARAELARAEVPQSIRWALTGETKPVDGPLSGVRRKAVEADDKAAQGPAATAPASGTIAVDASPAGR